MGAGSPSEGDDTSASASTRARAVVRFMIVAEGSPRQLIVEHASREVLELRFPNGTESIDAKVLEGIGDRYERLAERVIVGCENGEAAHARALEHGLNPESWLVRRSSLEDVFLRLTGRTLDE